MARWRPSATLRPECRTRSVVLISPARLARCAARRRATRCCGVSFDGGNGLDGCCGCDDVNEDGGCF